MMHPKRTIEDLPECLLNQIAQDIGFRERRTVMPVLSQRWAGLLQGPGPAWEKVSIEVDKEFPDESVPKLAAMAAWFGHRPGSVRELLVTGPLPKLPASLLATVLTTQVASLRVLHLDVAAVGAAGISAADLAMLAALSGLEDLTINLPNEAEEPYVGGWDDHAVAAIESLSQLPALRLFTFKACEESAYCMRSADAWLPTVSQLAALQSPTLKQMRWGMASTPVGTLALGALPALIDCCLEWNAFQGHVLHVTPASFSGALGLTRLTLGGHAQLQLAPSCFRGISMLVDLNLYGSGLTAIPAALSVVGRTLRRLDLSYNPQLQLAPSCFGSLSMLEDLNLNCCKLTAIPAALSVVGRTLRWLKLSRNPLQIDQAGFDTLLALPLLESLDLTVSEYFKNSWTIDSTRFLVKFLIQWQRLHPGVPCPDLSI